MRSAPLTLNLDNETNAIIASSGSSQLLAIPTPQTIDLRLRLNYTITFI
ncbi:MAG: hypothetical protein QXU90_01875 [Acidilobaceae archaeon]